MPIERSLIDHCAPTLAGLKTGSLFAFLAPLSRALLEEIRAVNEPLRTKGLELRPVRALRDRTFCYLYRESQLSAMLEDEPSAAFLRSLGYEALDAQGALATLMTRLRRGARFPHEIGLFLGYPLGDVLGFIEHRGKDCLCCGLWKSYTDPRAAQRWFDRCAKCTSVYRRLYESGRPLCKLAVSR